MTTDPLDLLVSDARLLDGRLVSIGIAGGRYRTISDASRAAPEATTVIDAGGGLVTPSFVDGHLHLEKAYTLHLAGEGALTAYTSDSMGAAMRSIVEDASAVKRHYDASWIMPNVRRVLDDSLRHGVLHMQAFVDVDTTAQLVGMEAVLAVREEYRDLLDLQVVAFPQDGLLRDPGAAELCEEAIALGADVVGGIPWLESTDREARLHVDWACALAARTGRRVAMLVDDAGDPSLRTTEMLAESMIEHGLQGRGVACHGRAIGTYPMPSVIRLAQLARAAGLGFVSDPHTGPLHLPVREFLADGVQVALGQDDIEDAYYPFGRHNMLEVAFLAAHHLQFLSAADQSLLIEMVTSRAADVLGMAHHGIVENQVADLCVHEPNRVVDLLREHAAPRAVVSRGRVVAETETTSRLLAGPGS